MEAKLVTLQDWRATPEHTFEVTGHYPDVADAWVKVWVQSRPHYCDRGHWVANVTAQVPVNVDVFDWADGWPRYFMDLGRALRELTDWLNWRLYKSRVSCDPGAKLETRFLIENMKSRANG